MKKGTIVKFSAAGLVWLYPRHDCIRERAAKKRFEFSGVDRDDPGVVRVKRTTSNSYVYYHNTFIEPA